MAPSFFTNPSEIIPLAGTAYLLFNKKTRKIGYIAAALYLYKLVKPLAGSGPVVKF